MNKVKIFNSEEFGAVRTVTINGMVVTRITIGGQQYTAEELGEEKAKEIVRQRMEAAVESMGYERSKE